MGIQKFRADVADAPDANGAVAWRTRWMGGTPLAKVVNCPIDGTDRRQVAYATDEPDTFFSIPGAIMVRGQRVTGFFTYTDEKWLFTVDKEERSKL